MFYLYAYLNKQHVFKHSFTNYGINKVIFYTAVVIKLHIERQEILLNSLVFNDFQF